jgi:DNA-binding transcriptional regulator YhcF (GntR family)
MPGLRLVIGLDGDPRAWVQVANDLLELIAIGAVRAGSRVPPVTSLGLETTVPLSAAIRAYRELASEGVLHWVPRLGYHVRTSITVPVSTRPRRDGGLTALLPAGPRQQTGHHVPSSPGTGDQ